MTHVTLQRRHGPHCAGGHPANSFTFEAEEQRKGWKKCHCRIYAHGTLSGIFYRLATRQRDWNRAREILAPYLAAGRWEITPPQPPPPTAPTPAPGVSPPPAPTPGLPVADAVEACLEEQENCRAADNTIRKYRQILGKFLRFSEQLGLRTLEEWTRSHVRQFRASWKVSPLTASKNLGYVKAFFELFVEDEVIESNPARILTRRNRALAAGASASGRQKNPYTNQELERMHEACRRLGSTAARQWPKKRDGRQVVAITEYRDYHRKWTGQDLADFMDISVFTGLRISDVATFDVASRMTAAGEVNVREVSRRATKNAKWVSVPVPPWLGERIRSRALRFGPRIFGEHTTRDLNVITDVWRRKLKVVWKLAGEWEEPPTHHRFRHTFVRILLENRVDLATIAELTGDTEQMIRKHYSAWMPGRQENVSRILAEAFRDVPRFHPS